MNPLDYLSSYQPGRDPWQASPSVWQPDAPPDMPTPGPQGPNVVPVGPLAAQTLYPQFQVPQDRGGLDYASSPAAPRPQGNGLRVWSQPGLDLNGNGMDGSGTSGLAGAVAPTQQQPRRGGGWLNRQGIGGGTVGQNLLWGLAALLSPGGAAQGAASYVNTRRQRADADAARRMKESDYLLRARNERDLNAFRGATLGQRSETDAARTAAQDQDRLVKIWGIKLATQGKTRDQILGMAKDIGGKYGWDQDTMAPLWEAAANAPATGELPALPQLDPTAQPGSPMDTGAASADRTRAATQTEDAMRQPKLDELVAQRENLLSQIKTRNTMTPLQAEELRVLTDKIRTMTPLDAQNARLHALTIDPATGVSRNLEFQAEHPYLRKLGGEGGKPSPGVLTWRSEAVAAGQKYGVPPEVILGVIDKESSGNPDAANGSHVGLGQFGAAERAKYGGSGPDAIGHYLSDLTHQTGSLDKALRFYRNGALNPAPEPGYSEDVMRRSWNYGPDTGKAKTAGTKAPIMEGAPSAALPSEYIGKLGLSPSVPFGEAVKFERWSRSTRAVVDQAGGKMLVVPSKTWTAERDKLNAYWDGQGAGASGGGAPQGNTSSVIADTQAAAKAGVPLATIMKDPDYENAPPAVQLQMRQAYQAGLQASLLDKRPPAKKARIGYRN